MKRLALAVLLLGAVAHAEEPPPASADAPARETTDTSVARDPQAAKAPAGATAAASRERTFRTMDRLELGTTSITGNQELPKVMYVVPWKKADLGDLPGKPARSLIDEILAPVDRDVFRREVGYFDALDGATEPQASQAETAVTPEKAGS